MAAEMRLTRFAMRAIIWPPWMIPCVRSCVSFAARQTDMSLNDAAGGFARSRNQIIEREVDFLQGRNGSRDDSSFGMLNRQEQGGKHGLRFFL